jgi:hypothetical protein
MRTILFLAAFASFVSTALGQSFNVAIGPADQAPSSSYAGAGMAGHWMALPVYHNTTTFNLTDVNGQVTNVNVWQYGGTELKSLNDPATSGDHEKLMDHCQVTYTLPLETCLFFRNLEYGDYEIVIYAWMPGGATVRSLTSCDEEPGQPHHVVGGAWPGQHQEFVTFARHRAPVGPPQGLLRLHAGIVPGDEEALGAACNGVQVRKLPPKAAADLNCDGAINGADIAAFVDALTDSNQYHASHPTCRIDNADVNNDGQITLGDVEPFVAAVLAGN